MIRETLKQRDPRCMNRVTVGGCTFPCGQPAHQTVCGTQMCDDCATGHGQRIAELQRAGVMPRVSA
jgi:hypothetical protein